MNTRAANTALAAKEFQYPKIPALSLKNQRLVLKLWLVLTDAIVIALAFRIAFWIRFDLQLTTAPEVEPSHEFYFGLIALLIPVWLLIFLIFNLYNLQMKLGGIAEYARAFNACTTSIMILVIVAFFEPTFIVSRVWLAASWLLTFFLVAVNRFVNRRLVYVLRERGFFLIPAVILGTNQEALTLALDLSEWRYSGLRIVGFVGSSKSDAVKSTMGLPQRSHVRSTV